MPNRNDDFYDIKIGKTMQQLKQERRSSRLMDSPVGNINRQNFHIV